MKNNKGLSLIIIVVIIAIIVVIACAILGIIVGMNKKTDKPEIIENNTVDVIEQNIQKENTTIENEVVLPAVSELQFTKEFLEAGQSKGNVEIIENTIDGSLILSITGNADNDISGTGNVSTKNRWYKTIDITDYDKLEFFCRKGQDNGDMMICIDNKIIKRVRFNDLPTTWTKYTIDLTQYKGNHTISLAGGYADNTGSEKSNTQYCNIKLKP